MDNDPLDKLLAACAEDLPPLPLANLESRVWREIRARRSRPAGVPARLALLTAWLSWLKPAHAAVAVAALTGVLMGHLNNGSTGVPPGRSSNRTGESLGLGVFSADPPTMPSTLPGRQP